MSELPWAPLRPGRRCAARLRRELSPGRWGRCDLERGHTGEAHALECGMQAAVRWDDVLVWTSAATTGQRPLDERINL